MSEHVLIRNAGMNNAERVVAGSGVFTQTRIGTRPFAVGHDGRPRDVSIGDRVYIAQSGYGIVGSVRIVRVDAFIALHSHDDIPGLKLRYPKLEAQYWEHVRDDLDRARKNGKVLWFIGIWTERERVLGVEDHFPLNRERGAQSSWITLGSPEVRDRLFKYRGTSSEGLADIPSDEEYGKITPHIRVGVSQIWKGEVAWHPEPGESIHLDHFIPRALGGPGNIVENVVPMPDKLNLEKRHQVVRALPMVAIRWNLVSPMALDHFGDPTLSRTPSKRQREIAREITAIVKDYPRDRQRGFYFEVLCEGLGDRVRTLFEAAGIQHQRWTT